MEASDRVRTARLKARLTQSELSRLSGVPQSHISVVERGKVEPTDSTVEKLVEAARVRPSELLGRHREQVIELVKRRNGRNVRVFGSVARGQDHCGSDVDLLIDFDEGTSIFTVAGLARELEELLGVHVDIISGGSRGRAVDHAETEAVAL